MGLEHKLSDPSASMALGLCRLTDVERGIQAARQDMEPQKMESLVENYRAEGEVGSQGGSGKRACLGDP